MTTPKSVKGSTLAPPMHSLDEAVATRLNNNLRDIPEVIGETERVFGLRLKQSGGWQRHPASPSGTTVIEEKSEPPIGSSYDEPNQSAEGRPVRTLTDFAIYDSGGRLVPIEALELAGMENIVAFGTITLPSKDTPRHIIAPAAEKWRDSLAEAVFLQPPLAGVSDFEVPTVGREMSYTPELVRQCLQVLDDLLVTGINLALIQETGLARLVDRLRSHEEAQVQYQASLVKAAWLDILQRGGSEPTAINIQNLRRAADKLGDLVKISKCNRPAPSRFHSRTFQLATLVGSGVEEPDESDPEEEDDNDGADSEKRKSRTSANAAEIIAEYQWNGRTVEPPGPHEGRLKQMVDYVRELLGCTEEELIGWRMSVHRRKKGTAFGQMDSYFFTPEGKRYRSRNEVGKAYEAGTFGQNRPRSKIPPVLAKPSQHTLISKMDSGVSSSANDKPVKSSSAIVSPLAGTIPMLLTMPQPEDIDNIDLSFSRKAHYEYLHLPPLKPLRNILDRESDPSPDQIIEAAKRTQRDAGTGVRVRLEPTGWAISSEYGRAAVYLFTEVAAYRLVGDLVVARPAPYYYSSFCSAFLTFEACRLVVRAITDYTPRTPASSISLAELLDDILHRSRLCPGRSDEPYDRLIVPISALRFFYYPSRARLTADHVVCKYPLIHVIVTRHFAKNNAAIDGALFLAELASEHERRSKLEEKNLVWAIQDEQRRRANEKRKAMRIEMKERERVQALVRKLENDGDLRPEDLLLVKSQPIDVARKCSSDPLMIQAIEKFLLSTPMPAELRPSLIPLEYDPAMLDGAQMLRALDGLATIDPREVRSPVGASTVYKSISLSEVERSVMTGKLTEANPVIQPDELGETFARLLQIWEGATYFSKWRGVDPDLAVGSFPKMRRQVYESALSSPVFPMMLEAVALDDITKRNPPAASVDDLCYHVRLEPEYDFAYDLTNWPCPTWLVNENTFHKLLWSAMCDWLRHNPEMAALEALECGEVTQGTLHDMSKEAGSALREQATAKNLDFIAICDDGVRGLMQDPDAEEFCVPVNRNYFPDYDKVIARPMDLGTIRERIASGHYDISRAPAGAYLWDSEKYQPLNKQESKSGSQSPQNESDDDDDDDEKEPTSNLLTLLADYRSGSSGTDRPDCGKCRNCLDKPQFGGYNTLRLPCKLKQQAEQLMQSASTARDSSKKLKTKDLWKRRQAAIAREETLIKLDEMYFAHDCVGGGHEGIAADVRLVFRNCRVYNKGTTPIYRAASKLDSMFNSFYIRMVASRDPRYATPRIFGFPETVTRDAKLHKSLLTDPELERTHIPRIRRGFPSTISTVRAFNEATDLSQVSIQHRIVALQWLVDRAMEATKIDLINPLYAAARLEQQSEAEKQSGQATIIEPLGMTRDFLRVWATPGLIKESGGLVFFENAQTGQWLYLEDSSMFEAFCMSLDTRGRREWHLKRALDKHLIQIQATMRDSNRDFVNASEQLRLAEESLAAARFELEDLLARLSGLQHAAETARSDAIKAAEVKYKEDEEARHRDIENKRKLWAEAWTADKKVYYYHVETRQTTWVRPKDMDLVYHPRPKPQIVPDTEEEALFSQANQRIIELKAVVHQHETIVAKASIEVNRDRALLCWSRKLRLVPTIDQSQSSNGILHSVASIVSSILSFEKFSLGDPEQLQQEDWVWPSLQAREDWLHRTRSLVFIISNDQDRASALAKVISEIRELLSSFLEHMLSKGPLAFSESLIRQRLVFERWRWNRFFSSSKSLSEVAVALSHLQRFFRDMAKDEMSEWQRQEKARLLHLVNQTR